MIKYLLIFTLLVAAILTPVIQSKGVYEEKQVTLSILYPRSSIPVITQDNGTFTIIYKAPSHADAIEISTAYDPIPDIIKLKIISDEPQDGTWRCKVLVPPGTPEELYNLTIYLDGSSFTEPRAVCIKDRIDGNFTFVHLTDFHIGDPRGMKVSVRETIGWKAAKKCIEEINLLNPDFVIITGDLVFGQLYPFEYKREYEKCYHILQRFQVPTFLCPGNHDGYVQGQDGSIFWKKYFGFLNYTFNYGKALFVAINSYDWPKFARYAFSFIALNWGGYIGDSQLRWIEEVLSKSNAKLKVLMLHHNPLWDTHNESLFDIGYVGREELLKMIEKYDVDAVFDGHVHYDNVTVWNGTLFITTTTAASNPCAKDAYWGYRLITVKNWSIVSYNYREPKYSIPSYHINCREIDPYSKEVENDLETNITVHLTFLVPVGNYSVNNGHIVMERVKGNEAELYIDVKVPEKNKVLVKLERMD